MTIEDALEWVQGDPDKYSLFNLYFISNVLSMCGFMLFLSMIFLFQDPKLECFNPDLSIYYRCSKAQACGQYKENYKIVFDESIYSFITQFQDICSAQNFNAKAIFAFVSALIITSQLLSGCLMDRFGRKKIIAGKSILTCVFLTILMILGLTGADAKQAIYALFFLALFSGTFFFDIVLLGFEQLINTKRENYVILLSATRFIGIGLLCISFYFLKSWVYFICIELGLLVIFTILFIRFTQESPHFIIANTGSQDHCRTVLNVIADANDEEHFTDPIVVPYTALQILSRLSMSFKIKNLINSKAKFVALGLLALCWLAYATSEMLHFIFLEQVQTDIFLDIVILGASEFLAALLSKLLFMTFTRRVALGVLKALIVMCFFFLLIFKSYIQTRYAVTITTRAALQMIFNVLLVYSYELLPTEGRATGFSIVLSLGLLGGIGFPFVEELNNALIIIVMMMFISAIGGLFLLRESKPDICLKNFFTEIFPDQAYLSMISPQKSEQHPCQSELENSEHMHKISIFDNIMHDINEAKEKVSPSKFGNNQKLFDKTGDHESELDIEVPNEKGEGDEELDSRFDEDYSDSENEEDDGEVSVAEDGVLPPQYEEDYKGQKEPNFFGFIKAEQH